MTEEVITGVVVTDEICLGVVSTSTQTLYLVSESEPGSMSPIITTTLTFSDQSTSTLYQNVTIITQGTNGVSTTCTEINGHYNETQSQGSSCGPCV